RTVKYLGITLDNKVTYWEHIKAASDKAAKRTTMLSKLMANVGGPTQSKRKLLMSVTESVMLYGSEIWSDALKQ
ncbi:hypothetical protein ACTGYF_10915, partial [Streptococcus suis]